MRLPHLELAVVPLEKITDYLLDESHPDGRGKAAFFLHVGFSRSNPEAMIWALLNLVGQSDMTAQETGFGVKYAGAGPMVCPNGRVIQVVSVWMLRMGEPPPYFVTAYPA